MTLRIHEDAGVATPERLAGRCIGRGRPDDAEHPRCHQGTVLTFREEFVHTVVECAKLGFKTALAPKGTPASTKPALVEVETIREALREGLEEAEADPV